MGFFNFRSIPVVAACVCLALGVPQSFAKGRKAAATAAPTLTFQDQFDRLDLARWYVSDGWSNGAYQNCTWSKDAVSITNSKLVLTLRPSPTKGGAFICGEVQTNKRLGYGVYEARMKSAAGSGLDSAFFTYIGPTMNAPHDEIDFEFLGKSPRAVQLNYWVSGTGGHEKIVPFVYDASMEFHDYAFEWTKTGIRWFVDRKEVRAAGGQPLPSNPSKLFFNLWAGGPGTEQWLGAFAYEGQPKTLEVDWVAFTAAGDKCQFAQSLVCTLKP